MPDMEFFVNAADRIGATFAILLFVLLVCALVMRWLGKSVFERMLNSHLDMVKAVKRSNSINSRSLRKMTEIEDKRLTMDTENAKKQDEILTKVTHLAELAVPTDRKLDSVIRVITDQTRQLEAALAKQKPDETKITVETHTVVKPDEQHG